MMSIDDDVARRLNSHRDNSHGSHVPGKIFVSIHIDTTPPCLPPVAFL